MPIDRDEDNKGETKPVLTNHPNLIEVENSSTSEEIWFDGDELAQASRIDWDRSILDKENIPSPRFHIGSQSNFGCSSALNPEKICDLSFLPSNAKNVEFGFGWGLELSRIIGGLRPRQALWIQASAHQALASDWMAQLVEGLAAFRQSTQQLENENSNVLPSILWVTTAGFNAELWLCKYLARWTQTDWRMLIGGKTAAQAFHLWSEVEIDTALDRCRKWEQGYLDHIGRSLQIAQYDSDSIRQLEDHIINWLHLHESVDTLAIIAFSESFMSVIQSSDAEKRAFANCLLKIRQKNAATMIASSSLISIEQSRIGIQQGDILLRASAIQGDIVSSETISAPKEIAVMAQIYGQGDLTSGICKFCWIPEFGRMCPWDS